MRAYAEPSARGVIRAPDVFATDDGRFWDCDPIAEPRKAV